MDTEGLDPNMSLKGGGSGKTIGMAVLGLLVVGGGIVGVFVMKQHEERKKHAAVMQQFAEVERNEVGKFWQCVIGDNFDIGQVQDNLTLGRRIEGAFNMDLKNFPQKVREKCVPMLPDAKKKLESIAVSGLNEYQPPLSKYATGLDALSQAFVEWAQLAPAQIAEREVGKKVAEAGEAWHAFEGPAPSAQVIGYDRFFHCAVPDLDKMKDMQGVVEFLATKLKDDAYQQKLNNECGKEVTADPPGSPTPGMRAVMKKMQADARELEAFDMLLRKSRKAKRRDDFEGVGKAWLAYMEAGREVRKVGQAALSEGEEKPTAAKK